MYLRGINGSNMTASIFERSDIWKAGLSEGNAKEPCALSYIDINICIYMNKYIYLVLSPIWYIYVYEYTYLYVRMGDGGGMSI
jgi:hypothetical protein